MLSLVAALFTIALKGGAWALTGSVGLQSDAVESLINLLAAGLGFWLLTVAARPPDEEHAYGHTKAEYFASGAESTLIIVAAGAIAWTAWNRLFDPQPLENVGIGLAISTGSQCYKWGGSGCTAQGGQKVGIDHAKS